MWDGANPQSSARRRDASDVGRPPFGAALYSRLPAAHEARGRSSPSRVTIADAGKEGVPPPSPASPHGDRQGRRTVPPISPSAKPAEFAASLSGPLDEIGSPSAAALPMLPPAALPPSHPPPPRLAGGMARPPAKPNSRSAPHESTRPRFHPPRQQARRRARQARPRRNRRRHNPSDAAARRDVIE